jgi:hypothetical protein
MKTVEGFSPDDTHAVERICLDKGAVCDRRLVRNAQGGVRPGRLRQILDRRADPLPTVDQYDIARPNRRTKFVRVTRHRARR